MRNLMYGSLFLALVGMGMVGCKKDNHTHNQKESNDFTEEERLFIDNLLFEIEDVKQNFVATKSGDINPSFSTNPYDAIGVNHNIRLAEVHNHSSFTKDAEIALQIFDSIHVNNTGKAILVNTEEVLTSLNVYFSDIISAGELNYNWIDSLSIPFLERQTLALYFSTVYSTNDIELRLSLSKTIETSVKNSFLFSNSSKEHLLTCFSIFRHSTVYWSNFDGYAGLSPYSEAVDALVKYYCIAYGEIGGFDVGCTSTANSLGSIISAVFDIIHRFL